MQEQLVPIPFPSVQREPGPAELGERDVLCVCLQQPGCASPSSCRDPKPLPECPQPLPRAGSCSVPG